MFKPRYVCIDYETALLNGSPSTEFYRGDFRVLSCSFAWYREDGSVKSIIKVGEEATLNFLRYCESEGVELIAHNYSFEYGVTLCRFPGLEHLIQVDTMRLAQMTDNGGVQYSDEEKTLEQELAELEGVVPVDGLALESCASRFLSKEFYKHKKLYHNLIKQRGGKKEDLHLLTTEELSAYNKRDAEVTLELYKVLTDTLKNRGIDWTIDHELYKSTARLCTKSKIRGVHVDKSGIHRHIARKKSEFDRIVDTFRKTFKAEIEEIEAEKTEAILAAYKSEKGREAAKKRLEADPVRFNFNSGKQKEKLFCEKLGIEPQFRTKKGAPTFSSKYWFQWQKGGELMKNRGTILISLKQGEALIDLIEYDGLWHISIKAAGCKTGRLAGGKQE